MTSDPLRQQPESLCTCRPEPEQVTRDDVFIWRGDPTWWSCTSCDERVRALTREELEERAA